MTSANEVAQRTLARLSPAKAKIMAFELISQLEGRTRSDVEKEADHLKFLFICAGWRTETEHLADKATIIKEYHTWQQTRSQNG